MSELPNDPLALAQACAEAMYERDIAARELGIGITAVGPGAAELTMRVRQDMLNGHGMCHGGFIFALADTAFAYACNSRNNNTVAQGCSIDYVAPGLPDALLTATAEERNQAGRTGVYDVTVTDDKGQVIALFRGKSYRIKGEVLG
ncbi:hydroxyphenylacetyl-CoA thioesterase PaaI [Pseudomaricurvus alkylphenolicus]|jgi:acyl-CoA thioesterase|uniref:hydroxyphenylacetyl-CoA thioesterase PaaI n=1 Tax=Pseudomaricurvus alkylphenolicus TaxID=1306991 RepID=UPI00141FE931|nr:hydroxyphenylacetyl-CoA thioesterase PaaI [Pseudomaricurvus alkylphenolicus]NIB40901.1 hydroxyphenylacetyl-CoA thioesterase PaaI [Pseudomaricurvus alkylphenolicus]